MRIAIIGWGSLIWSPRELPHEGPWLLGGPALPIEFSRISRDGRLTLVIDPQHGAPIRTLYATSTRASLADAVEDLARREACPPESIGAATSDEHAWCSQQGFDGAVWTALESTFRAHTGSDFSPNAAALSLDGLKGERRARTIEYLDRAPPTTDTPLRRHLAQTGLISPPDRWGR